MLDLQWGSWWHLWKWEALGRDRSARRWLSEVTKIQANAQLGGNLAGWKQQLGLCGRGEVMKNDGTCCETLRSEDLS